MSAEAAIIEFETTGKSITATIDRARSALATARTAAEVLDARDRASIAYDMAKKAARLAKAKGAADTLIAASHRMQADALEIEANAKRRLADEYDAAQDRGEVFGAHDGARNRVTDENAIGPATAADLGLSRKDIHEARQIRDAEESDPGIIRRTLDAALDAGEEPTKAKIREAIKLGRSTEALIKGTPLDTDEFREEVAGFPGNEQYLAAKRRLSVIRGQEREAKSRRRRVEDSEKRRERVERQVEKAMDLYAAMLPEARAEFRIRMEAFDAST